jgi:hypothetical protein
MWQLQQGYREKAIVHSAIVQSSADPSIPPPPPPPPASHATHARPARAIQQEKEKEKKPYGEASFIENLIG